MSSADRPRSASAGSSNGSDSEHEPFDYVFAEKIVYEDGRGWRAKYKRRSRRRELVASWQCMPGTFATEDEARQKWAVLKPMLNTAQNTGRGSSAKPPRASSADGRPPRPPSRPVSREQAVQPDQRTTRARSRSTSPQMFGASAVTPAQIIGGVNAPRALRPLAQPPAGSPSPFGTLPLATVVQASSTASSSMGGAGAFRPRGSDAASSSSTNEARARSIRDLYPGPPANNGGEEEEGTIAEPARPAPRAIETGRPRGRVKQRKGSLPTALREELGRECSFVHHRKGKARWQGGDWQRGKSKRWRQQGEKKRTIEQRLAMAHREDEVPIIARPRPWFLCFGRRGASSCNKCVMIMHHAAGGRNVGGACLVSQPSHQLQHDASFTRSPLRR